MADDDTPDLTTADFLQRYVGGPEPRDTYRDLTLSPGYPRAESMKPYEGRGMIYDKASDYARNLGLSDPHRVGDLAQSTANFLSGRSGAERAASGIAHGNPKDVALGAGEFGLSLPPIAALGMGLKAANAARLSKAYDLADAQFGPWGKWSEQPGGQMRELLDRPAVGRHEINESAAPRDPRAGMDYKALNTEYDNLVKQGLDAGKPPKVPNSENSFGFFQGQRPGFLSGHLKDDPFGAYAPEKVESPTPGVVYDKNPYPNWNDIQSEGGRRMYEIESKVHKEYPYGAPPRNPGQRLADDLRAFGDKNHFGDNPRYQAATDQAQRAYDLADRLENIEGLQQPRRDQLWKEDQSWENAYGDPWVRELFKGMKYPSDGGPSQINGYNRFSSRYSGDMNRFDREFPNRVNPLLLDNPRYVRSLKDEEALDLRPEGTDWITGDNLRSILSQHYGAKAGDTESIKRAYDQFMADEWAAAKAGRPTEHDRAHAQQWLENDDFIRRELGLDPHTASQEEIEAASDKFFAPYRQRISEAKQRLGMEGRPEEQWRPRYTPSGEPGKPSGQNMWWATGAGTVGGLKLLMDRSQNPGDKGMKHSWLTYKHKWPVDPNTP